MDATISFNVSDVRTLMILLKSSDLLIVNQSVNALIKYAETCIPFIHPCIHSFMVAVKNQSILLQLNIISEFMELISLYPNSDVYKHAIVCISILTEANESHPSLKTTTLLKILISAASSGTSVEVQDEAAHALANLARDYATKTLITKLNGLHVLIEVLDSIDPDVKMSVLTAISNLLDDFMNRCELKRISNGILKIIKQMSSEYLEIKQAALDCLTKFALESENRILLREYHVLTCLSEQLTLKDLTDTYYKVFLCMANCIKDSEILKEFPNQNPTLSIFKIMEMDDPKTTSAALLVIFEAALNKQSLQLIVESGIANQVITLTFHANINVSEPATKALSNLIQHERIITETLKSNVIENTMKYLVHEDVKQRRSASILLSKLSNIEKARAKLKILPEFIPTLCKVLVSDDTLCIQTVSETISKLSEDVSILQDMIKGGIVNAFGTALENRNLSCLILAFTRCIQEDEARSQFAKGTSARQVIIKLIENLKSSDSDISVSSIYALSLVCKTESIALLAAQNGAIDAIMTCMKDPLNASVHLGMEALIKVLEQNAVAKYWFKNFLCESNVIQDGFYDIGYAGKSFKSIKFPSLDQLKGEKANPFKREILLMDPKQDMGLQQVMMRLAAFKSSSTVTPLAMLKYIANVTAESLGGLITIDLKEYTKSIVKPGIKELKKSNGTNVQCLCWLQNGTHYHRALLFKYLCDKLNLFPCTLERNSSGKAWNTVDLKRLNFVKPKEPVKEEPVPAPVAPPPTGKGANAAGKSVSVAPIVPAIPVVKEEEIINSELNHPIEPPENVIIDLLYNPGEFLTGMEAFEYTKVDVNE